MCGKRNKRKKKTNNHTQTKPVKKQRKSLFVFSWTMLWDPPCTFIPSRKQRNDGAIRPSSLQIQIQHKKSTTLKVLRKRKQKIPLVFFFFFPSIRLSSKQLHTTIKKKKKNDVKIALMPSGEKYEKFKKGNEILWDVWELSSGFAPLESKAKAWALCSHSPDGSCLWGCSLCYIWERFHLSNHGGLCTTIPCYTSLSAHEGKPHNGYTM